MAKQWLSQIIFQFLITITLFSFWAGFALLVINKLFYKNLPGYTIGRICIWEFVAFVIAAIIAQLMINRWGNIEYQKINNEYKLIVSPQYGIYFSIYFLVAIITGIWQFWLFSQNF